MTTGRNLPGRIGIAGGPGATVGAIRVMQRIGRGCMQALATPGAREAA